MRLRTTPGGLIAEDTARRRWARLPEEGDLLSFLSGGREAVARNGHNYVEAHHNWDGLMKDFERHLELLHRADLCGGPVTPRPLPGQQLELPAPCKS